MDSFLLEDKVISVPPPHILNQSFSERCSAVETIMATLWHIIQWDSVVFITNLFRFQFTEKGFKKSEKL